MEMVEWRHTERWQNGATRKLVEWRAEWSHTELRWQNGGPQNGDGRMEAHREMAE